MVWKIEGEAYVIIMPCIYKNGSIMFALMLGNLKHLSGIFTHEHYNSVMQRKLLFKPVITYIQILMLYFSFTLLQPFLKAIARKSFDLVSRY